MYPVDFHGLYFELSLPKMTTAFVLFAIAGDLVNPADPKIKNFTNAFNSLQLLTKTEAIHTFKKPLVSREKLNVLRL